MKKQARIKKQCNNLYKSLENLFRSEYRTQSKIYDGGFLQKYLIA